ncbi:MAG: hypothetical protein U5L76_00545 [Patescibacteria group bacterium]|nr:hypothetical protein [Patescibacteria group bacterium]
MKEKTNKLLFYLAIFSLIFLFFIEIFSSYDTPVRQAALALTGLSAIIVLLIVFQKTKSKLQISLPFYIAWTTALAVWFDALGNFAGLYEKILWWDKLAHVVGSGALTLAFFFIFYELNKKGKIKLGKFNLSLYSISLAVFLSSIYEVSEFLGDQWFATRRVTDLYDTADDMMWNIIAGIVIVIIFWLLLSFKRRK